jgi:dolichol-phosphate mannosyltransferase
MQSSIQESSPAKACSVSIIVPTYHEVENLRPLVLRISAAMSQAKRPYEIVIVDDNSRDGTERAVQEMADLEYPVRLERS